MEIRHEKESEISYITQIHNLAFNGPDEGNIIENLRRSNHLFLSLVYAIDGKLGGHIAYSPVKNKDEEIIGIALAFVAVLPCMQNEGIGSQLIRQGNKEAFRMGYKKIFVLGDPKYYSRFGFVLAKEYNYYCEYDPKGDHFMVVGELRKLPENTRVYYCKEFKT